MTLSQIANLVCAKVRHTEAEDVTLCQQFIGARYAQLFKAHLWKDSVAAYVFQFDLADTNAATLALSTAGVKLLPASVERVLAARSATLDSLPGGDSTAAAPRANALTGRDLAYFYQLDYDRFQDTGEPTDFVALPALVCLNLTGDTLTIESDNAADAGEEIVVEWVDASTNERNTTTVTLGVAGSPVEIGNAREVLSVASPGCAGVLSLAVAGDVLVSVAAGATAAPLRVPIQIMAKPTETVAYRLMVKRAPLPMTGDNEQVDVRGLDAALTEYAIADMREWAGQVQTAQVSKARGDELLGALLATEILQTHANPRLIPADGFGPYPRWDWGGIEAWTANN